MPNAFYIFIIQIIKYENYLLQIPITPNLMDKMYNLSKL